jgi:TPR repeat protein
MKSVSLILIFAVTLLSTTVYSSGRNLPLADHYFAENEYQQALAEYISIASIGNPRAYYQLGVMHHNGLGVEENFLESIVWFSLAAEYDFKDANDIVRKLLAQVSPEQQTKISEIIATYITKFGKNSVNRKYYPTINDQNIGFKIKITDNTERYFDDEDHIDNEADMEDEETFNDLFDDSDESDVFSDPGLDISRSTQSLDDILNAPYFLVVDYDIAKDGSRRNLTPIESFGRIDKVLYSLETINISEPTFKEETISFLDRTYKGLAYNTKREFREKQPKLYYRIRKKNSKFKNADKLNPVEKYKYASLLMNVTWLESTDEQINQLLRESAEEGVKLAQLEYGLKLYREQTEIKSAIDWITKAAQQTERRAEYTLGKILLDSPWVVRDEAKALMWLESAAKKKHMPSMHKVAELKLLATDKSLRNIKEANEYLAQMSKTQNMDPIYHYLRAIAYTSDESRQLGTAFQHMRKAISLADDLNWDTTAWNDWLMQWGQGRVTVQDL